MCWFYRECSCFHDMSMEQHGMIVFGSPDVFCQGFLASRGFRQVPEPAAKSASKKPSAETSKKACSQGWLVQFDFIEVSFIRAVILNLSVLIRSHMFWFYSDSSWHFNGTTWNDFERLFFGSPDVFCNGFLASRGFRQVPEPAAKSASKKPSAETSKKACSQGWLVQFDFIEGSFIRAVMLNLSVFIRSHMFWFYSDSSWHFNGTTWNDFERLFFGSPDVFCQGFLASRGFRQVPKTAAKSASKKPSAETSKEACSQGWLVQFDFIEGSFIRAVMLNLYEFIIIYQFWFVRYCMRWFLLILRRLFMFSWHVNGTTWNDSFWMFLAPQMFSARGFWQAVASVRFQRQQPKVRPRSHLPRPAKRLALRVGWYSLIL